MKTPLYFKAHVWFMSQTSKRSVQPGASRRRRRGRRRENLISVFLHFKGSIPPQRRPSEGSLLFDPCLCSPLKYLSPLFLSHMPRFWLTLHTVRPIGLKKSQQHYEPVPQMKKWRRVSDTRLWYWYIFVRGEFSFSSSALPQSVRTFECLAPWSVCVECSQSCMLK